MSVSPSNIPYQGRRFDSWADAEKFLDAYATDNFFKWSVDHSVSVKAENERLIARNDPNLYDAGLRYKNVQLVCVCGGKRRTNNGRGERPHQSTWKTGCLASVHLIAKSKTQLEVVSFVAEHNHRLDQQFYNVLPKVRTAKLKEPEVQRTSQLLFKAGVKIGPVRSVLRSMGCGNITQRDLANERARWKKEGLNGMTPEQKVTEVLQKLLDADPGAYIFVGRDKDKNLKFLFIQTSAQRKVMEEFGEVLLLDHTYNINKNKMPVTVLMAMDGNCDGRSVGYAFLASESSALIAEVLTSFKTAIGEEVADRIQTVIVDKDYTEVKAIHSVLPNVKIQLCDFHVSRTFKSKTLKEDPKVKSIVTDMRFCGTSEDFAKLLEELKAVASETFMKYFNRNWLSCEMAWTFRDRKKSINLGNNTNNRLENHNSKIKTMLNRNQELYQAIEGLLELVQNKEDDVVFRNTVDEFKESYYMHSTDPVVKSVLNDLRSRPARLTLWELKVKVTEEELQQFKVTENECQCVHWSCYLLPCRHMFTVRRQQGVPVYNKDEIGQRWWKLPGQIENPSINPSQRVFQHMVPKLVPKTSNDMYNHSLLKAKQICGVMAESGAQVYAARYLILEELLRLWSEGKEVVVLELVSSAACVRTDGNHGTMEAICAENEQSSVTINPLQVTDSNSEKNHNGDENGDHAETPLSTPPKCFCGNACIRLISKSAKWPNNPYFKCATQSCRYWSPAPKYRGAAANVTRQGGNPSDVNTPNQSNENGRPDAYYRNLLMSDDHGEVNLAELCGVIEALNETGGGDNALNNAVECSEGMDESDRGDIALSNADGGSNELSEGDRGTPTTGEVTSTGAECSDLVQALHGIKLPTAVKVRGRPRGLGKTVFDWSKRGTKGRPRGAVLMNAQVIQEDERRKRGLAIPDSSVEWLSEWEWSVISQRKDCSDVYRVTKSTPAFCDVCQTCECTHHIWKCECYDHVNRKITCKHIFKIIDYASKSKEKVTSVVHPLFLGSGGSGGAVMKEIASPHEGTCDIIPIEDAQETSSSSWLVKSQEDNVTTSYVVHSDIALCLCDSDLCVHQYKCECKDYIRNVDQCKHVLKVVEFMSKKAQISTLRVSGFSSNFGNVSKLAQLLTGIVYRFDDIGLKNRKAKSSDYWVC